MTTSGTPTPPQPGRPITNRTRWTLAIGSGVLCLVMIIYSILKPSDIQPEVSRSQFTAARKKWKDAGIKSYNMRLTLSGHGSEDHVVDLEVRRGSVTKSLFDGKPEDKRTEAAWTVENQFRKIAEDLDKASKPNGFNVQQGVFITLHADFDPEYGYPDHYFRQAHGPSPLQSRWKVNSFEIVPENDGK